MKRRMLQTRFVIPILHRARTMPMVRTTRARTFERVVLAAFCASLSLRLRLRPAMNAALQAALGELFLDLIAAIGAIGPHVRSRVARIKNISELLTVVHARVAGDCPSSEFLGQGAA
jgi:hypothetical protein